MRALWLPLACLSTGALAQPFVRTPVPGRDGELCVTWNARQLIWRVAEEGSARTPGDTEYGAIDAAWAAWQQAVSGCSDFEFIRGPRISAPPVADGSKDSNVLVFREALCRDVVAPEDPCLADGSCVSQHGCWDYGESTIAITRVSYSPRTGVITDADIEFNAANFLFTTVDSPPCAYGLEDVTCVAYDLQNTATHEIGHVLGFAHVEDDPESTMAPTAPLGETSKRRVDPGSALGLCQTYPRGRPPASCDPRNHGNVIAQTVCASAGGAPAWLALLTWLLAPSALRPAASRRRPCRAPPASPRSAPPPNG